MLCRSNHYLIINTEFLQPVDTQCEMSRHANYKTVYLAFEEDIVYIIQNNAAF